ncbi:MAG TPA: GTP cyclohydrolase I [Thermoanaerobaculia bacterium]|jgi:GTP cyclohydrolase I|nr:GTP cyclohydrolase I [Thermoanaerobaculia bacterium]
MKDASATDLVLNGELEALINERGTLSLPRPTVDRDELQAHLREALRLLHVDLDDENVRETPRRWAESLIAMTSGYDYTDVRKLTTLFRKACSAADENCQNLVVIGGTYKTLCAHHILPFFGRFIIGYIPEKMVIGASKIPRIVEVHMRRLQSQEHLAHDVADTIQKILEPRGLAVWMGGVHLCMVMRGVEQESSFMETNVLRGDFLQDERTRQEFMSIVNRRGSKD